VEVLFVTLVVHVVDADDAPVRGELGNVVAIEVESEDVIVLGVDVLVVLLGAEGVLEGHRGDVRRGGAAEFELDDARVEDVEAVAARVREGLH